MASRFLEKHQIKGNAVPVEFYRDSEYSDQLIDIRWYRVKNTDDLEKLIEEYVYETGNDLDVYAGDYGITGPTKVCIMAQNHTYSADLVTLDDAIMTARQCLSDLEKMQQNN